MSQFRLNEVWTEREGDNPATPGINEGDWEACVPTSYAMALLYGGVVMAAPYTQAERERLEFAPDEPQNLATTDLKAKAVYGVRLRGPSVTASEALFLARPGTGFCLTGTGSPVGAQVGTFTHEVFAVALDLNTIAVYDPLLPAGSAPVNRTVAHMVNWMSGIAPHQVREVRKDEFGMANSVGMKQAGTPIGTFKMPPGPHALISPIDLKQFPQPNGGVWGVLGVVDVKDPAGNPMDINGNKPPLNNRDQCYLLDAPNFGVAALALRVDGIFTPTTVSTPDCAGAVADATSPLKQRIEELEQSIRDHVEDVTKPEDDLLATVQ